MKESEMRHLKVLGVTLTAMFALCVTALGLTATSASALTLPDVALLSGESFPFDLHFIDNGKTPVRIETTGGSVLVGKGYEELLLLVGLGALGPADALALNVKLGNVNCNTPGDAAGEVLWTGEWHLVPIRRTPLINGFARLLTNLIVITCGVVKVDLRGCMVGKVNLEEGKDFTEAGLTDNGEKGKDSERTFLNDKEEETSCTLQAEFSNTGKFSEADAVINEGKEFSLSVVNPEGGMFSVTGLI
jgi:hypothetical protein